MEYKWFHRVKPSESVRIKISQTSTIRPIKTRVHVRHKNKIIYTTAMNHSFFKKLLLNIGHLYSTLS